MQTKDVVIQGYLAGFDPQEARQLLAKLFKTSSSQIDQICSNFPYTVKKGVDVGTAEKYRASLAKAGFDCSSGDELTFDLPPPVVSKDRLSSQNVQAEVAKPAISVARKVLYAIGVALIVTVIGGEAFRYLSPQTAAEKVGSESSNTKGPNAGVQQTLANIEPAISPQAPAVSSRANNNLSTAQKLSPDELAIVERLRTTPSDDSTISNSRGTEIYPGVEIHYKLDQFGQFAACQIEFVAKKFGSEIQPARKWFLLYFIGKDRKHEFLHSDNFFGTQQPLRMFFDSDNDHMSMTIDKNDNKAYIFFGVSPNALTRMMTSKQLKVMHGVTAAGEISFTYDISRFDSVYRIAHALCK